MSSTRVRLSLVVIARVKDVSSEEILSLFDTSSLTSSAVATVEDVL